MTADHVARDSVKLLPVVGEVDLSVAGEPVADVLVCDGEDECKRDLGLVGQLWK